MADPRLEQFDRDDDPSTWKPGDVVRTEWERVVPERTLRSGTVIPEKRHQESAELTIYGPGNRGFISVYDHQRRGDDPDLSKYVHNLRVNKDGKARFIGDKGGSHFRRVKPEE